MIRVTIDLLPHGKEDRREELFHIDIANDGTHPDSPRYGNYRVVYWHGKFWGGFCEIKGYHRDDGFWKLVKRAVNQYGKAGFV